MAASGDKTIRGILFDIARRNVWPAPYTGRVLRNEFSERWRGREAELMQHQADEAARYDKAREERRFRHRGGDRGRGRRHDLGHSARRRSGRAHGEGSLRAARRLEPLSRVRAR